MGFLTDEPHVEPHVVDLDEFSTVAGELSIAHLPALAYTPIQAGQRGEAMAETVVHLAAESDGAIRVTASGSDGPWGHVAPADGVTAAYRLAERLAEAFEDGRAKLADPVSLATFGRLLAETFLAPLYAKGIAAEGGALLVASDSTEVLNLPWELLPGRDGKFLVEDGRWTIRRRVGPLEGPENAQPAVAGPLRVLFMACAPKGEHQLDYEKEEDAILRIRDRLRGSMFLDILDSGTFDEARAAIAELRPHVVHLSGHGKLVDGVGHFYFEDDDGDADGRDATIIGRQLFSGHDVRAVFFSGCQTARAGLAGLCQAVTRDAHVPLALGWGASIADDRATEFAAEFYHRLGVGEPIDTAVAGAQRKLLADARRRSGELAALDASFALPQLYVADSTNEVLDPALDLVPPRRRQVRHEMLGDNVRGLREGFVERIVIEHCEA